MKICFGMANQNKVFYCVRPTKLKYLFLYCGRDLHFFMSIMLSQKLMTYSINFGAFRLSSSVFICSSDDFFYDNYQRKFTDYAITNERIIIATGNHNKFFKSILLKNLPQLQFISHEDTYGTIIFGDNDVFNKFFMQFPYQKDTTPKFEYVKNCDEPYRIIKELMNKN